MFHGECQHYMLYLITSHLLIHWL